MALSEMLTTAGLSNPVRSQTPFVMLEALSSKEVQKDGSGLSIHYGVHETPFGDCLIAAMPQGICNLQFFDDIDDSTAAQQLRSDWGQAQLIYDSSSTGALCDRIFQPTSQDCSPIHLQVKGTPFQIKVWQALLTISFGETTTYQALAIAIGQPKAARAIGNAVGRNPVGYLIPCHRVVRQSGEMGGYRWGVERKKALLAWEASSPIPALI